MSLDVAKCFKRDGFDWVAPRAYRSTGIVDTVVCTTLKNAYTAGISMREAYMFPCPKCSKSAATQVAETINKLNSCGYGVWTKRLWLDVENASLWKGNTTSNRTWYQQLVDACLSYSGSGVTCGVYSSQS